MDKKYKRLIGDTFIFALGSLGSKMILFFMVPLYTNYMTAAEYGISDLVFSMAQFIIPFVSVVIFDAVIRFGLAKEVKKENVLLVGFLVWGIAACITIVLTPAFGLYEPISPWKWYLSIYVILEVLNAIELNYLKVKNMNKQYAVISILQTGTMALLNVLFIVYLRKGISGYLSAIVISGALAAIVSFLIGGFAEDLRKARFDRNLMKQMIVYSSPLILNNISWWVIHSSDKIMITAMLTATQLGIYTVAAKIPSLINVAVSIFSQAWGISSVKEMESSNDTRYFSNVFYMYSLLTMGICIFFVSIIKIFMHFYVGEEFSTAWRIVPILLVSAVFSSVSSYYGSLYSALKKSMNNMVSTVMGAFVNIIVNFILIRKIGVMGAAFGTLAAYVVLAVFRMVDVSRYISIPINYGKFILNSLIILVQACLVSIDYHVYAVSIVAILVFIIVNAPALLRLMSRKNAL